MSFKHSFNFLLSFQLLLLQQTPKNVDSPVHIGQKLGTSVSGHEGQHARFLPPLQSTSLLPESQMCIGSPRENAGIGHKKEDRQYPGGPTPQEAR